jgi:hypothetical protein
MEKVKERCTQEMTAPISLMCLREAWLCKYVVLEVEWDNGPCEWLYALWWFEEWDDDFGKE